jgi:hypothetical protein
MRKFTNFSAEMLKKKEYKDMPGEWGEREPGGVSKTLSWRERRRVLWVCESFHREERDKGVVTKEEITYLKRGDRRRCWGYAGRSIAGGREWRSEMILAERERLWDWPVDGGQSEWERKWRRGRGEGKKERARERKGVCAGWEKKTRGREKKKGLRGMREKKGGSEKKKGGKRKKKGGTANFW